MRHVSWMNIFRLIGGEIYILHCLVQDKQYTNYTFPRSLIKPSILSTKYVHCQPFFTLCPSSKSPVSTTFMGRIGWQWLLGFTTRLGWKKGVRASLWQPSQMSIFLWSSRDIGRTVRFRALAVIYFSCYHTLTPSHVNQFQWFVSLFLTSACLSVAWVMVDTIYTHRLGLP